MLTSKKAVHRVKEPIVMRVSLVVAVVEP